MSALPSRWDGVEQRVPDSLADLRGPATQLTRVGGRRLAGHTGSMPGFLATVWADPSDRVGVLFMANSTSGVSRTLLTELLAILDAYEPRLPAEWEPATADADLLELTGPWYWGPSAYALRLLPGRGLSLNPIDGAGRASRFAAQTDGTWLGLDGYYAGERLSLVRRADGSLSHLDLNTFVFTRTPYDPAAGVPGGVDEGGWRG